MQKVQRDFSQRAFSDKAIARRNAKLPVETITIIRLETKSGIGIYSDKEYSTKNPQVSTWNEVTNFFVDPTIHPKPDDDYELESYGLGFTEYHFGFKNVEQYKAWFFDPAWRIELAKRSIVLSTYEIEKEYVKQSKFQVMFKKDKARLISQESPYKYF